MPAPASPATATSSSINIPRRSRNSDKYPRALYGKHGCVSRVGERARRGKEERAAVILLLPNRPPLPHLLPLVPTQVLRPRRAAPSVQLQRRRHGLRHLLPRQRPGSRPPGPGCRGQEVSVGGREGRWRKGRTRRVYTEYLFPYTYRHRAAAEALDASLCECDNRLQVRLCSPPPLPPFLLFLLLTQPPSPPSLSPSLPQETATKVVALVDRFKLSLPFPLRLDRNHGSESLEVGEGGSEGGRDG